jgi:predicted transcriptional regulator
VGEQGGASVGQAAEGFGAPRGLARSTVLTMMERLRQKGHLDRRQVDGVFQYFSPASAGQVMQGVVRSFVERTLGGSLSPFVTYLTEEAEVSDAELAELEGLVARLQSKRKEEA